MGILADEPASKLDKWMFVIVTTILLFLFAACFLHKPKNPYVCIDEATVTAVTERWSANGPIVRLSSGLSKTVDNQSVQVGDKVCVRWETRQ